MNHYRFALALLVAAPLATALPRAAFAQSTPSGASAATSEPAAPEKFVAFDVAASQYLAATNAYRTAGASSASSWLPEIGIGVTGAARIGIVRFGALFDAATTALGPSTIHAGGFVGPSWSPLPSLRLDLTGEVGASYTYGIGNGFGVDGTSGATTALLPYVGAKLASTWRFGRGGHGNVGVFVAGREDLTRVTVTPEVTATGFFSQTPTTAAQSFQLGGTSVLGGVQLGYEF